MDEPVDYGELGAYLTKTRGLPTRRRSARPTIRPGSTTPRRSFCSAGGRSTIWRRMTDAAFDYQRAPDDPRIVWYPG